MTDPATPPPKAARGRRLLLGAAALIVVAGGSAAGAVYLTGGLNPEAAAADAHLPQLVAREDADEEAVARARRAPRVTRPDPALFKVSYIPIEENFTSNLAGGTAFIQLGLSLSTYRDERVVAAVEEHALAIRSAVLVTLAEQDAQVLTGAAGKDALRATLVRAINRTLVEREGFGGIDDVQFTAFVMQ